MLKNSLERDGTRSTNHTQVREEDLKYEHSTPERVPSRSGYGGYLIDREPSGRFAKFIEISGYLEVGDDFQTVKTHRNRLIFTATMISIHPSKCQ